MWYHRKWALSKPEPHGMVRFTLSVLADHCDENHECWVGLDRLAFELGLIDKGTASRHCAKLAEMGIIEIFERWREDGTQSSNLYRLNVTDRELQPFIEDPKFDPYKKERPARLERRRKVREKQETARAMRLAVEGVGEPLGDTPGEGYAEGPQDPIDPGNIAGVTPASMQGSPLQDCAGHPGDVAGVSPAVLPAHEQSLETSVERSVDETGESSAATAPPNLRVAGGERTGGLPAGHGAKAAPCERDMHQESIDASTPPLRLVTDDYAPTLVAFDEQPPGLAAQWDAGRRAAAAAAAAENQKRSDGDERPDRVHLRALETIGDHEYVKLTRDARDMCPGGSLRTVYRKAYELGIERGLIKAA
jgi:DNA-binding transcriptional ArsR family regulator